MEQILCYSTILSCDIDIYFNVVHFLEIQLREIVDKQDVFGKSSGK